MHHPQREPSRGRRLHGAPANPQRTTTRDRAEGGRLRLSGSRRTWFGAAAPPTARATFRSAAARAASEGAVSVGRTGRGARLLSDTLGHGHRHREPPSDSGPPRRGVACRSTPTPITPSARLVCSTGGSTAGLKVGRQPPASGGTSALRGSDGPARRGPSSSISAVSSRHADVPRVPGGAGARLLARRHRMR